MNRAWIVDATQRLPVALLSRGWGWLARRERPRPMVELLKRGFVAATGIDMSEAAAPIASYPSLEALFVRALRRGARRIDPAPAAVVCPVDGAAGACGTVEGGALLQIKGRGYSLAGLLDDAAAARRFEGGAYATFYLSPRDYHRVHAPLSGMVREARVVPGRLLPVFPESLAKVDELFARNERLVTYIDHEDAGRVAVVMVGATLVGRMSVTYDAALRTNDGRQAAHALSYDPPRAVKRGELLGAFELGSTVVLVGEAGRLTLDGLSAGQPLRVGQRLGTLEARRRLEGGRPRRVAAAKKTTRVKGRTS